LSTLSDIQVKIKSLLEEKERLKTISRHLEATNEKLEQAYIELDKLDKQLDNELKDIKKLESIGVKSVFYNVLGNKEEQLDKERQEYLEASLKYKSFRSSVDLMEYEREILEKKLDKMPRITKELEELKDKREGEILKSDPELAAKLRSVLNAYDQSVSLHEEMSEALDEGEKSHKMLDVVLSYLRKARDWGRWDMQGNKRGELMKHSAIDKALATLSKAQYQLDIFEKELRDLGKTEIRLRISSSQFDRVTDYFFDNLISDWIVQQKIKSTISSIESSADHVKRLCLSLERESKGVKDRMLQLQNEKDAILLS